MRIVKWGLIFIIAFIFAWVMIFTFNQEPFKTHVPAKLLMWQTPSIPVYFYLTGAFLAGLLIGLFIAVYDKIVFQNKLSKKSKQIQKIEQEMAVIKIELEQSRMALSGKKESLHSEHNTNTSTDNELL